MVATLAIIRWEPLGSAAEDRDEDDGSVSELVGAVIGNAKRRVGVKVNVAAIIGHFSERPRSPLPMYYKM